MPPLRLGLVGAGRWGRICLRSISEMGGQAVLTAIASANPQTAELMPSDCRLFAQWRDLLDADICDAVVIVTPTATHIPIAAAALARNLAVFIEKPLCFDPAQAVAFRDQALRAGLPVLVDHIHLFSPAFRRLVELTAQSGPIVSISAQAGKPGAARPDTPGLWDWGAHDVAMCLKLMNQAPAQARPRIAARPVFTDGAGEIIDLNLDFGAVQANLRLGALEQRSRLMTVQCADAVLIYDDLADVKLTRNGAAVDYPPGAPLKAALSEFCAQIRAKTLDVAGLDLAIRTVQILDQAQQRLDAAL